MLMRENNLDGLFSNTIKNIKFRRPVCKCPAIKRKANIIKLPIVKKVKTVKKSKAKPLTRTQGKFIGWFKKSNPKMFKAVMEKIKNRGGLGATEKEPSIWDNIVTGIKDIAPAYLQYESQRKIMDVQVNRAKRGLSPLETSQLTPTVRVQAGASPEIMNLAKMAIPAVLGVGAILMLTKKKR